MSQRSRVGGTASGCPRLHDVQAPLAWRPQVGGNALTDVPGFMMVWPPCTMAASGWWHCPRVSQAPRPVFRPAKGSCTIRSSLGRCLASYPSERSNTHHKASRGGPARICSCVSGRSTRPLLFWPSQVYNSFSLWFFGDRQIKTFLLPRQWCEHSLLQPPPPRLKRSPCLSLLSSQDPQAHVPHVPMPDLLLYFL